MLGRLLMRMCAMAAGLAAIGCNSPPAAAVEEPGCSLVVDRVEYRRDSDAHLATIQEALDLARAGDIICVRSTDHADERVHITSSGTSAAPIQLRGQAAQPIVTRGFIVQADHVTIEGFEVRNAGVGYDHGRGYGIYLAGTGLTVVGNTVIDSEYDGIGCEIDPPGCVEATIAHNLVKRANGSGIIIAGRDSIVEGNEVTASIKRLDQNDADGIRFFGSDLIMRYNYVHDIFDEDYPENAKPHTDCFQTFDNGGTPTVDVLIEHNRCVDVNHQCLIATAETRGQSARITFRNNICRVAGAQAVLVRQIPQVTIVNNIFTEPIRYYAIMLLDGARGARLANNVYAGSFLPYDVDESSQPGFSTD